MTVGDKKKAAEGLGDFFKNLGRKRLNLSNNMAKKRFEKSCKSSGNESKRWYCIRFSNP